MIGLIWKSMVLATPDEGGHLVPRVKAQSEFVFISESRLSKTAAERLRVFLGFEGCFTVEPVGRSGGLVLLWNLELIVSVGSYSRFHINARICINKDVFF